MNPFSSCLLFVFGVLCIAASLIFTAKPASEPKTARVVVQKFHTADVSVFIRKVVEGRGEMKVLSVDVGGRRLLAGRGYEMTVEQRADGGIYIISTKEINP